MSLGCTTRYKYGRFFWAIRFTVVLIFFILVLAITVQQIRVSTAPTAGEVPTVDEIAARYLPEWRPVFQAVIAIGSMLLVYELLQMTYYPSEYFRYAANFIDRKVCGCAISITHRLAFYLIRSPFNWVDLAACLFPIAGCIIFLRTTPSGNNGDIAIDGGPRQIWPMAFGILALYLNMVSVRCLYFFFFFFFGMDISRPVSVYTHKHGTSHVASSYSSCESSVSWDSWSTSSSILHGRSNGSFWSLLSSS